MSRETRQRASMQCCERSGRFERVQELTWEADMSGSELGRAMPRHALSELALDAIIEIDRALAQLESDPAPVRDLGRALLESSAPQGRVGQFNLVEPDYFHPFERLFRERQSTPAQTIEEIRSFVRDSASSLLNWLPR
jgi:hypothetical protein